METLYKYISVIEQNNFVTFQWKGKKKGKTIHFQLLLNIHKPSQNKYLELLNIVTTPYLPGSASTCLWHTERWLKNNDFFSKCGDRIWKIETEIWRENLKCTESAKKKKNPELLSSEKWESQVYVTEKGHTPFCYM